MRAAPGPQTQAGPPWPFPPNFTPDPSWVQESAEPCVLVFEDGTKTTGTLAEFAPNNQLCRVIPQGAPVPRNIAFEELRSLRLTNPLAIRRPQMRLNTLVPASLSQDYVVEFHDGTTLKGKTVGFVANDAGLYLFDALSDDSVERSFFPPCAVRTHQIGEPLGEVLIKSESASRQDIESALERQRTLRRQRLGDFLAEHKMVRREELAEALKRQESMPVLKLGEALLELEFITDQELHEALARQKANRKLPLGEVLLNMGIIDQNMLNCALATKLGIPFVDLSKFKVDPNAAKLVEAEFARTHHVMPLYVDRGALVVAMENPLAVNDVEALRFKAQTTVIPVMALRESIMTAIDNCYDEAGNIRLPEYDADFVGFDKDDYAFHRAAGEATAEDLGFKPITESFQPEVVEEQIAGPADAAVRLINKILLDAHQEGASDIHIECLPEQENSCVRLRKDGVLRDHLQIPWDLRNAVISRVKSMANLDIVERHRPQDGKLDFQPPEAAKIELRVATIPTANGLEDVVMRPFAGARPRSLDEIGMSVSSREQLTQLAAKRSGLILVCGPTRSGTTTTLHSLLGHINTRERKIWTAEDPIEITQPGLRQVQVNAKIGWTLAAAMRAFLRADPDIIMVGEMNDFETARISVEAAFKGHLVLSTLHTDGAAESVVRLLDMGLDPCHVSGALIGVLSQRLARKLCERCAEAYVANEEEIALLAAGYCGNLKTEVSRVTEEWAGRYGGSDRRVTLRGARGCAQCGKSGYDGRTALHELLVVTGPMRRLIQRRASAEELRRAAMGFMRTLKQDGIDKVLRGITDLKQVYAACS